MIIRRGVLPSYRRPTFDGLRLGPLVLVLAASGALAGCGGEQKPAAATPATAGNVPGAPPVDRSRCKAEGKRVTTSDLNGDNKPDVWKYYVPNGQGADVLTCKQIDYNHDGKVDSVYYYDDAGAQTTLEEFDMDFDGRFEETVYYVGGKKVRIEMDMDFDGKPDVWKYFEDEKLVRMERDTDSNGRVDQWEYYEAGKLDRIGYDTTGSGKVDRWDRAPEGAAEGVPERRVRLERLEHRLPPRQLRPPFPLLRQPQPPPQKNKSEHSGPRARPPTPERRQARVQTTSHLGRQQTPTAMQSAPRRQRRRPTLARAATRADRHRPHRLPRVWHPSDSAMSAAASAGLTSSFPCQSPQSSICGRSARLEVTREPQLDVSTMWSYSTFPTGIPEGTVLFR